MRRSSYRNASQQSVAGFVAMVTIRYFSGANDKKSAKKYAKAVGRRIVKRARGAKEKGNTVTGSWVAMPAQMLHSEVGET
ncbi:unnamed protein product [Lasius platythorax]|uniref:Uncharacterized protein n=1 Tax=Lasius platythorax TaxID=488582 RepID=A0AAV2NVW7_9HYME